MPVSPTDDAGVRVSEQDDAGLPVSDSQDVNTATSSGAGDEDGGPSDLLDAVKEALGGGESSDPEKSQDQKDTEEAAEGAEAEQAEGAEDGELGELTDDELKRYKPKTRRRIEQLLGRIEEYRPAYEQMQHLNRFMAEARLTPQDVNNGFAVMRLVKNDPVKALEVLEPMVVQLRKMTGFEMPDDLKKRVEGGYISEQEALELSRLRAGAVLSEEARRRQAAEEEARRASEAVRARAAEVGRAVSDWERRWSKSDPDYSLKKQRVLEKVQLAAMQRVQQGRPLQSAEEALALAEKCREEVEQEIAQFRPRPRASNPVTGSSATQAAPAPDSYLDAVIAGAGV